MFNLLWRGIVAVVVLPFMLLFVAFCGVMAVIIGAFFSAISRPIGIICFALGYMICLSGLFGWYEFLTRKSGRLKMLAVT